MHDLAQFVDSVITNNLEGIDAAAEAIVATGKTHGLVYAAGSGHSLAAVLETFFRAGGLAFVRPLWDPSVFPLTGAREATAQERQPQLGASIAAAAGIQAVDTAIIFSNSGVNPYPVEIAQVAKSHGATVIAVTSITSSAAAPRRAETSLAAVADIVLDTNVPPGDASWPVENPVTSPVSSLASTALWSAILRGVHDRWPAAPCWQSANLPGTDTANAALLAAFAGRIPEL